MTEEALRSNFNDTADSGQREFAGSMVAAGTRGPLTIVVSVMKISLSAVAWFLAVAWLYFRVMAPRWTLRLQW
jgi:hypothetical protein